MPAKKRALTVRVEREYDPSPVCCICLCLLREMMDLALFWWACTCDPICGLCAIEYVRHRDEVLPPCPTCRQPARDFQRALIRALTQRVLSLRHLNLQNEPARPLVQHRQAQAMPRCRQDFVILHCRRQALVDGQFQPLQDRRVHYSPNRGVDMWHCLPCNTEFLSSDLSEIGCFDSRPYCPDHGRCGLVIDINVQDDERKYRFTCFRTYFQGEDQAYIEPCIRQLKFADGVNYDRDPSDFFGAEAAAEDLELDIEDEILDMIE